MTTATERNYIFNRETLKIELHFDKAEYQALSEEQKRLLKSNFLFSRYSSAWVSRAKEPNLYHARQAAVKLGFTQEQKQGERLSFSEQVERQAKSSEAEALRKFKENYLPFVTSEEAEALLNASEAERGGLLCQICFRIDLERGLR